MPNAHRAVADHIDRALHDLASLATVALDAPVAIISVATNGVERLEAAVSSGNDRLMVAPRLSALLPVDERLLLVIDDASADPRLALHEMVSGTPHIRFYLESPILSATGVRVGALVVYAFTPHKIDARQAALVRGISNRIEGELQRRDVAGTSPSMLDDERVALRNAAAAYRLMIEQSDDVLVLVDGGSLRILEVNPSASTFTGFTREEL
ncbi:MAG: PAS domain S-box protein [Gemmatimonadaceae bacterium]